MTFQEFKDDLEKRLQDHLEKNFKEPEKVRLDESLTNPGDWLVYFNNVLARLFSGPKAHQDATKYALELLQADSKAEDVYYEGNVCYRVAPKNPCSFCGGYLYHREGCPDIKKLTS